MVVVLGFLVGIILVLIVGKNPKDMFSSIFDSMIGIRRNNGSWNFRFVGETLAYSMPFILLWFSYGASCKSWSI